MIYTHLMDIGAATIHRHKLIQIKSVCLALTLIITSGLKNAVTLLSILLRDFVICNSFYCEPIWA